MSCAYVSSIFVSIFYCYFWLLFRFKGTIFSIRKVHFICKFLLAMFHFSYIRCIICLVHFRAINSVVFVVFRFSFNYLVIMFHLLVLCNFQIDFVISWTRNWRWWGFILKIKIALVLMHKASFIDFDLSMDCSMTTR